MISDMIRTYRSCTPPQDETRRDPLKTLHTVPVSALLFCVYKIFNNKFSAVLVVEGSHGDFGDTFFAAPISSSSGLIAFLWQVFVVFFASAI
jgi:hypothetical protein